MNSFGYHSNPPCTIHGGQLRGKDELYEFSLYGIGEIAVSVASDFFDTK